MKSESEIQNRESLIIGFIWGVLTAFLIIAFFATAIPEGAL